MVKLTDLHGCEVIIDGLSIEATFILNDTFTRDQPIVRTKSGKEFSIKESIETINERWNADLTGKKTNEVIDKLFGMSMR